MLKKFSQPGIVIFADAAGKEIYDLIKSDKRLEAINASLKNAIGFIYPTESGDEPVYAFRYARDDINDAEIEKKAALKDAIQELKENLHLSTTDEDYIISAGSPVIYVIGRPLSYYIVNDLRTERIWDGEIQCLFLCHPSDQQQIMSEEWDGWKDKWQVISYDFFGNVSQEVYQTVGRLAYENELTNALLLSLNRSPTERAVGDIRKKIQDSVESQMATIRKRVLQQQTRRQEIFKKRRSRSRRMRVTGQNSIIEQLPWFPLAACQEGTFQGGQPADYEDMRNAVLQQTRALFQHVEGVQDFSERWVERFSERQRKALKTLTTIGKEMEKLWDYLEKDTLRNLEEAIKQIEGSLWVEDFCKQMQMELEALYEEQIKSENQSDDSLTNEEERISSGLNAGDNEEQAQEGKTRGESEEEKLRSDIKERVYMAPSFRAFSVMAVVVALILALQAWLFASAFTEIPALLLSLDFAFCLVLVVTGCRLYYKKAYIAPLVGQQKRMIDICRDKLVERCKQIEKAQRLVFIKKVESGLEKLLANPSRSNDLISSGESGVRELTASNKIEEEKR